MGTPTGTLTLPKMEGKETKASVRYPPITRLQKSKPTSGFEEKKTGRVGRGPSMIKNDAASIHLLSLTSNETDEQSTGGSLDVSHVCTKAFPCKFRADHLPSMCRHLRIASNEQDRFVIAIWAYSRKNRAPNMKR